MHSLLLHLYTSLVLLLLNFSKAQNSSTSKSSNKIDFNVGVILDLASPESPVGRIGMSCLSIARSDFYSLHPDYKSRLVFHIRDSNNSVVDAAAAALDLLQEVKVDAIIGPQQSTQVDFLMDLGERARVPIISFSATSPSLVPQSPFFVQTAQSDATQVQAIVSIVEAFKWAQVVIMYEETEFGNGIIPSLSNSLQDAHVRVSYRSVFPKSATDDFIGKELYKMMAMQTRVFLVHTSQSLGKRVFLKARELGMMSEGYVWIVTSGLTDLFNLVDSEVVEAMQGVIGVRPLIPKSKEFESFASRWLRKFLLANENHTMIKPTEVSVFGLWAYDTFWALAMAAERVGNNITHVTKNGADVAHAGPFAVEVSETGPKILEALLKIKFPGLAGEFSLVNGQLEQTSYEIVNVVGRNERQVGTWAPSSGISKNLKSIIWPGDSTKEPKGWEIPVINGKKLRIGVPKKPGFNEFLKVEIDPKTNTPNVTGYYKEVFDAVMKSLPYYVPYDYVPYPFFNSNGSKTGNYDNLVHEVSLQENYDGALGDITITATRSTYADFTLPYAEGGVASIVPVKYEDVNDIFTFLEPLTIELWLTMAVFYISTALAIWILANRTNVGSPAQHAGMVCYFPFFPGEGIEANLLCLILVTWAFVASLLNSIYTASLSSRITVARLRPMVTDVSQLTKNGHFVGCQEGSFLFDFLKTTLKFDEAKIKTFKSAEACEEALSLGSKNGGVSAYYDVMPHIKLLLSRNCGKYMIVGPIHRTDGFAFAFSKGSPLVADISRAIIQRIEDGTILEIEQRMTIGKECSEPETNSSPTSVTLRSFLVLFAITGCVTLTCLLVSLLRHLHTKRSFPQRISDFNSKVGFFVISLREYFKPNETSSLPRTADMQAEMDTM
ncbi:hypothetical protein ABFX02_14G146300 [Erythranthe guttata]